MSYGGKCRDCDAPFYEGETACAFCGSPIKLAAIDDARRAALLISEQTETPVEETGDVEREEFNDEQLLAHFYWRCDPHGPEPNTLALEIWEVLRNNINHPKVMSSLTAMRPVSVDEAKLAEIRARHDSVADMADDEWDNRIYTIADDAFSDRAFLLSAFDGVK